MVYMYINIRSTHILNNKLLPCVKAKRQDLTVCIVVNETGKFNDVIYKTDFQTFPSRNSKRQMGPTCSSKVGVIRK